MGTLVLVDGPNLFNDAVRELQSKIRPQDGALFGEYLREWFDIDRLVEATINPGVVGEYRDAGLGIVIFHSDRPIGRDQSRIDQREVMTFWARQGKARGTSTRIVTVPGYQPAKVTECPHCSQKIELESQTEKGVDTTMVTYLYESLERWESVVLFSDDADFVPPIWALRGRGRRVFAAARDRGNVSSPLQLASQTFFPLNTAFLNADFVMFRSLRPGGALDKLLEGLDTCLSLAGNLQISFSSASMLLKLNSASGSTAGVVTAWLKEEFGIVASNTGEHLELPPISHPGRGQVAQGIERRLPQIREYTSRWRQFVRAWPD